MGNSNCKIKPCKNYFYLVTPFTTNNDSNNIKNNDRKHVYQYQHLNDNLVTFKGRQYWIIARKYSSADYGYFWLRFSDHRCENSFLSLPPHFFVFCLFSTLFITLAEKKDFDWTDTILRPTTKNKIIFS